MARGSEEARGLPCRRAAVETDQRALGFAPAREQFVGRQSLLHAVLPLSYTASAQRQCSAPIAPLLGMSDLHLPRENTNAKATFRTISERGSATTITTAQIRHDRSDNIAAAYQSGSSN
jgi:hypothetical protein